MSEVPAEGFSPNGLCCSGGPTDGVWLGFILFTVTINLPMNMWWL